jgi:medium-chain acyl-[acyl-carrier-protein] hydrolase
MKLFCFPYAGGSAAVYTSWKAQIGAAIELVPIELTGRGRRIADPLYQSTADMIDEVFALVCDQIDQDSPYAFFGHSMGAIIAYEVSRKLALAGLRMPEHVFFSGRGAPDVKGRDKQYHLMSEDEFRAELINLGGTPPEFFEHPELMDLFLPVLKNDFMLAETAEWKSHGFQFETDITVFMGKADDMLPGQSEGWYNQTTGRCTVHFFEGDHFFLHQEYKTMVKLIRQQLKEKNKEIIAY